MRQAPPPEDCGKIQEEFITKIKDLSGLIYKELSYNKPSLSEGLEGTSRQYSSLGIPTAESGLDISEDPSAQKHPVKRELETFEMHSEEDSEKGKKIRLHES